MVIIGRKSASVLTLLLLIFLVLSCSSDTKSLKVDPRSLDFESVYIGDQLEMDVVLTNKFGKDITISNISLAGSSDYSIVSGGSFPVTILRSSSLTMKVNFTPNSNGIADAMITLVHDGSSKPKTIDITGIGVAVGRIELSETSYDYMFRLTNTSTKKDVEIRNIGTKEMTINQFVFTGTGASVYNLSAGGTIPTLIQPGSSHTITIAYEPTVVGTFEAQLEIYHDAVNENSPVKFDLKGQAVLTAAKLVPSRTSTWDFGSYPTSFPGLTTLELESAGTTDLTITSVDFQNGVEFTVEKIEDTNGNPVNLPVLLTVGDKIIVTIKFAPSTITSYNDKLLIVHDGLYNPSPYEILVAGSGKTPATQTFNYIGSIDTWTVPAGVHVVRIEVWGAQGGTGGNSGGKGARMRGDFSVTPGDTIKIIVGQFPGQSSSTSCLGGGGGGSYVWLDGAVDPMIVAGGGGGSGYGSGAAAGKDAVITINGTDGNDIYAVGGGGTNGNGGVVPAYPQRLGGGGAGWKTDGCPGKNSASGTSAQGGKCPANGGTGGLYGGDAPTNQTGGYGGGGGSQGRNTCSAAGGGGGYSGGGPGAENPTGVSYQQASGGGGGSYNDGANQDNTAGTNTNHGKIVIQY